MDRIKRSNDDLDTMCKRREGAQTESQADHASPSASHSQLGEADTRAVCQLVKFRPGEFLHFMEPTVEHAEVSTMDLSIAIKLDAAHFTGSSQTVGDALKLARAFTG